MVFDYDIIIIGAGPAGISAAGTLKKQGLKCALLEKTSQIGGSYYASMTNLLKPGPDSLLFSEIKNDIRDMQGFELIDPTTLNDRYFGYIEGPDIDLCLENNVYGAQVVMGSILSVDVSGPEGIRTLSAKVFIDASGGSFIRTIKPRKPETAKKSISVLAGGMGLHDDIKQRIEELEAHINSSIGSVSVEISPTINKGLYHIRITGDGEETRKALPAIMKQIEEFDGGSKDVFLIHGAGELYSEDIYTQDTRYVLEQNDVAAGRKFEDSVIEGETGSGRFYVPYRSLLPVGINNLLLCGRSIGARRELSAELDTLRTAYATGQAAALASLYCIKKNLPIEQADTGTISNPNDAFSQDYMLEEDADIYIENIDVEDLVEMAPEDKDLQDSIRPIKDPDDQESKGDFEPEIPEFDGLDFGMGKEGRSDEAETSAGQYGFEPVAETGNYNDKPFFTQENIMGSIDNPLYDIISDGTQEDIGSAAADIGQDTPTKKPQFDYDQDALAKSIEEATKEQVLQSGNSSGSEAETIDFPEEDIIDKLPMYMLFDEENNALNFSKTSDPVQAQPEETVEERSKVDELLSLLDVLPDQLPEGLYDFLKENSKAHKRDGEPE